MAKKQSEAKLLQAQLKAKDEALNLALKGLYKIGNLDPITYTVPGYAKPSGLGIVRAFRKAQEIAEQTLLDISDAEAVDVGA